MRRAVEEENQDISAKFATTTRSSKPRKKKRRRKPFNIFLLLIVLSPLAIIGCLIYALNQYSVWKAADADIEKSVTGNSGAANDQVVSHKAAALNQPKRLRKNQEEANSANSPRDEDRHELDAEIGREIVKNNRPEHKFLVLTTKHGNIKITLRPDLSKGSVDYIYQLVESYGGNGKRCMHCNFYRAEKPGILQGIMENKNVVPVNTVRGSCPKGAEEVPNDCPAWDKHCACHGPVMKRGAVAWAAGEAGGPDFFIDGYREPAMWWGTQHTNFGFIDDEASLKVVDSIFELPINETPDMNFLKDPIHFDLVLE